MKRLSLILILFVQIAVAFAAGQSQVYRSVEQMPQFPGGEAALMKYLSSHVQMPQTEEVFDRRIAVMQFVVEADGSIGEVKVVRSVMIPEFDAEAIRVVKSLPKFTPGRQDGQPVAVWYTIPVTFRASGDRNDIYSESHIDTPVVDTPRDTTIYRSVEQMPQFPGGDAALLKYINSHLQTPETQEQLHGTVILQFVVETDGSIGEVKVVRSVHPDYDAEAVRLIKSLPKFSPGRQNGQPVAVWYTLPVMFR